MNLKTRIFLMLAVIFITTSICHANTRSYQTEYGTVYFEADYPPVFLGGGQSGVPKFMRENFKYPKDAWKVEKHDYVQAICLVLANGEVAKAEYPGVNHSSLIKELDRVVHKMRFKAAHNEGDEPVNVVYHLHLPLRANFLPEGTSPYPYGLEASMDVATKLADRLLSSGKPLDTEEMGNACAVLGESFDIFPSNAKSSMTYAALLSAKGDRYAAALAMDTTFSSYHELYVNVDSLKNSDEKYKDNIITRPGYNGRTEVAVAVMRALQHDIAGIPVKAQAARDAMNLIDRRIIDGDLSSDRSAKDIARSRREIEKMQADMIQEFSRDRVQPDIKTPAWEKVTDFYSIGELSSALSYWDDRYDFGNAQVSQLKERIRAERENIVGGSRAKGDVLNLFGAKAFIHWLEGGNEGVSAYIASLRQGNPSKKLASYLDRLEKRLKENSELLADREGVVQSLACLVPPSGTSEADAEAFYARRSAAERVFPLRWLMK